MRFLQFLQALPIMVDGEPLMRLMGPVVAIGREHGLSAYDAAYLKLAARLGLSLATQDELLREAAKRLGVPLIS